VKYLSLRWLALSASLNGCLQSHFVAVDAAQQDASVAPLDVALPAPDAEPPPPAAPGLARNVIVFMGDGMGPEQLSTARFVRARLRLDELDGPGFVDTDSLTTLAAVDPELEPTDSAAAATVIATGERVLNGMLSVGADGQPLETVLEVCKRAGKATGLVTTSFFFDASPAAFAVHQASRDFGEAIIAQMLAETAPDVIMGSGAALLDEPALGLAQLALSDGYFVLRGVEALMAWDPRAQPRVLGLFDTDFVPLVTASELFSMTPALERRADSPDPTLALMTARALSRLADDPDGFFLFAEDEQLDQIGHYGPAEVEWANRAYPVQAAALDEALGVAIDWVHAHSSFEETLVVLLADHETGGYHYDHALGPASGSFSAFSVGAAFAEGHHTRAKTAVYALGPGSSAVYGVREHADTHRLLLGELPEPGLPDLNPRADRSRARETARSSSGDR
jgi:alkaline phosphatase